MRRVRIQPWRPGRNACMEVVFPLGVGERTGCDRTVGSRRPSLWTRHRSVPGTGGTGTPPDSCRGRRRACSPSASRAGRAGPRRHVRTHGEAPPPKSPVTRRRQIRSVAPEPVDAPRPAMPPRSGTLRLLRAPDIAAPSRLSRVIGPEPVADMVISVRSAPGPFKRPDIQTRYMVRGRRTVPPPASRRFRAHRPEPTVRRRPGTAQYSRVAPDTPIPPQIDRADKATTGRVGMRGRDAREPAGAGVQQRALRGRAAPRGRGEVEDRQVETATDRPRGARPRSGRHPRTAPAPGRTTRPVGTPPRVRRGPRGSPPPGPNWLPHCTAHTWSAPVSPTRHSRIPPGHTRSFATAPSPR